MDSIRQIIHFIFWFLNYEVAFAGFTFSIMDFVIWGCIIGVCLGVLDFFRGIGK